MEGGASGAQEPREKEEAGRQPRAVEREGGGGGMKFRVSARAPHGVGALLLIGGAVLAGAAVVAWRHARRGKRDQLPGKKEEKVLDGGGVVEDGKGGTSAAEIDQTDGKVEDNEPAPEIDQPDGKIEDNEPAPEIDRPDDKVENGASALEIDRPDDKVEDGESALETDRPDDKAENGTPAPEIDQPDDKVEGGASAPEIDQPDDKVDSATSPRVIDQLDESLREEVERTEIGSNGSGNDGVTEEIQEVHSDVEIVAEELDSEPAEKLYLDSRKSTTEISMHDDAASVHFLYEINTEQVEKVDQISIPKLAEVSAHDMDTVTVEKVHVNSAEEDTENDNNSTKDDTDNDQYPITNHIEDENASKDNIEEENIVVVDENSSKNNLKEEIATNENEDVEATDESSHSTSPCIVLDEQNIHDGGAQEAESMENSPTAQLMMHPEQILDDMGMDTEGEATEANQREGTVSDKDVNQEEQQKAVAEKPDGLAGSPALPSLVKPTEKKEPDVPGRIETGMKIEQDYTNGGLKEHGLINNTKGGSMSRGAVVTMDRRSSSVAILALMFALTVGIAIVVRLYAPPRATKLLMDLQ